MSDKPLSLTESELRRYEEASWTLQKLNLELNLIQLEQRLHQSDMEKANLKIKLATRDAGDKTRKIKEHKKTHADFNKSVCERLGFEEGTRFAYDPLTGEVDPIREGDVNE